MGHKNCSCIFAASAHANYLYPYKQSTFQPGYIGSEIDVCKGSLFFIINPASIYVGLIAV